MRKGGYIRAAAAVALAAAAVTTTPRATAATAPEEWGPPPQKCPIDGCYGSDYGPNFMDNTTGDLSINPHVIEIGEKLTATWSSDAPAVANNWEKEFPGLKAVGDCAGSATCVYKATAGTGGWVRLGFNRPGGGVEQDYYGVVPRETAIAGKVTNRRGDPLVEKVTIRGESKDGRKVRTTTTPDGRYRIPLKDELAGRYTLRASLQNKRHRLAFRPAEKTLAVRAGRTARADFEARELCAEVFGGLKPKTGDYYDLFRNITLHYSSCLRPTVVAEVHVLPLVECNGFSLAGIYTSPRMTVRDSDGRFKATVRKDAGGAAVVWAGQFLSRTRARLSFVVPDCPHEVNSDNVLHDSVDDGG